MAGTAHTYAQTRRGLHGLAELVLAGPRFRQTGDLRLRVRPEGVGTWDDPVVALSGSDLVVGDRRIALDGLTIDEAARLAGLDASSLDEVYSDGPHVPPSETLRLDAASVRLVEETLAQGDQALQEFRPDADRTVWPEHFDVATTVDGVNYGVCLGDGHFDRPYAYVGPHRAMSGGFWNAPFGASRPMTELAGVSGIVDFFTEGARLASAAQ